MEYNRTKAQVGVSLPMQQMKKSFSQELHNQFDSYGKRAVKKYFMSRFGIYLLENEDRYAVDMIAYKDGTKLGYVEIEVRESWSADSFPFDSLHIPERKGKLLCNDLKTVLVSVNKIGSRAFICKADIILNSPMKERRNKYVESGEKFYLVDPSKIRLVNLKEEQ